MKKIKFLNIYKITLVSLGLAIALPLIAADTGGQINYQARLLDSYGRRVNDTVDLSFKIYDAVSDGNLLWSETQSGVVVQDGVYSVILGSQTAISNSVFAQNSVYLELGINGETMSPRQQITASAYSLVARTIMGSNVYENQTSGYLGVGTTNPAVKLDVSGTVQATGFKMPTGATANYVLASDADGVGTWQPFSVVLTEHDPIHTNWVRVVYTPATNSLWIAIGAEATTRGNTDAGISNAYIAADTTLQGNVDAASNALNTAVGLRVLKAGDIMTGPLTNTVGFFGQYFTGDGGGLTNIQASGVSLTGVVHRIGDSMTGPLVISNNLTVAFTNADGATNFISLGGVAISNWNQVTGGDLTNELFDLRGATSALNTSVASLNISTGALDTNITLHTSQIGAISNVADAAVKRSGDIMTGTLTNTVDLVVNGNVGIGASVLRGKLTVSGGGVYLDNNQTIYWRKADDSTDYAVLRMDAANDVYLDQGFSIPTAAYFNIGNSLAYRWKLATPGLTLSDQVLNPFFIVKDQGTTADFTFNTGTNGMFIKSDGLVGIGLTTPTAQLHVNGSAIIETNLTVNGVISNSAATKWNNAVVMKEAGGSSISFSNLYYLASGNTWSNANAVTNLTAQGLLGLALGTTPQADGMLLNGYFTNCWGFSPGATIYMDTNNGALVTNMPTGTNNIVRIVGYAINTTNIYFNPDRTYIEIMGQ